MAGSRRTIPAPDVANRTPEEWKKAYERAHAMLLGMEGDFEPGTPMTPRCEAELDDGRRCNKGRGHRSPCGVMDLRR